MTSVNVADTLRRPYARVIVPDGHGRFAAHVVEFPGCFADGDSPDEAYANLEEVAESWVESASAQGMPIPEPFETQGYRGNIALRLPKTLHRSAANFARRDGVSLNQFILYAVADLVGGRKMLEALASRLDGRIDQIAAQTNRRVLLLEEFSGAPAYDMTRLIMPSGFINQSPTPTQVQNLPLGKEDDSSGRSR